MSIPPILRLGRAPAPAGPEDAIPLGAALVIEDLLGLPEEYDLVAVAECNPWAVIAALRLGHQSVIAAWRRHLSLRDMIELDCAEALWESELRRQLAAAGPPEPKEVVAYISATRADPTFARALLAELLGHSRPGRSARHSAFKRRGPLTANGWMGLYTIVRALCLPGPPRLPDAAALLGIDPRTLRRHCHQVLGLDWHDARQGIGWKWAVERALRSHGYLPDEPPLPLAFHHRYAPPPESGSAASVGSLNGARGMEAPLSFLAERTAPPPILAGGEIDRARSVVQSSEHRCGGGAAFGFAPDGRRRRGSTAAPYPGSRPSCDAQCARNRSRTIGRESTLVTSQLLNW